jgi:hypothetical protein
MYGLFCSAINNDVKERYGYNCFNLMTQYGADRRFELIRKITRTKAYDSFRNEYSGRQPVF